MDINIDSDHISLIDTTISSCIHSRHCDRHCHFRSLKIMSMSCTQHSFMIIMCVRVHHVCEYISLFIHTYRRRRGRDAYSHVIHTHTVNFESVVLK